MQTFKISEIFLSIQGEARNTGKPVIFIRLYGCAQKCVFCDSTYTWKKQDPSIINTPDYKVMTAVEILEEVKRIDADCKYICLTGGDPDLLTDSEFEELVSIFNGLDYEISIESSGFKSQKRYVDNPVVSFVVMDIKCPSAHASVSKPEFISDLRETDQVKILVEDEEDWKYAETALEKYPSKCEILFSAIMTQDETENKRRMAWLANKIISMPDVFRKRTRMNFQLHRLIWGNERGK